MNIILFDFEIQNLNKNGRGQIRRLVNPPPIWIAEPNVPFKTEDCNPKGMIKCPFGAVGEEIWVKETWCRVTRLNDCCGKHSNLCGGIDSWDYYKAEGKNLPDGFA